MLKRTLQKYIFKHIGNQDRQCIHQKEWHNIVTAEACRRTMINWIRRMAALCRYCTLLVAPGPPHHSPHYVFPFKSIPRVELQRSISQAVLRMASSSSSSPSLHGRCGRRPWREATESGRRWRRPATVSFPLLPPGQSCTGLSFPSNGLAVPPPPLVQSWAAWMHIQQTARVGRENKTVISAK